MSAGGEKVVCQLSVIGDKEKPFCIFVKPSNRKKIVPSALPDQVEHCLFTPVFRGGYDPGRFVEHIVFVFFIDDRLALKKNLIFVCINFDIRTAYCSSVDGNTAGADVFFDLASRSQPHIRQILVKSYLHADCHRHPGRYLFFSICLASFPNPSG